jgi:RNA polymerase sigma-70 factor (ECF subfamily)
MWMASAPPSLSEAFLESWKGATSALASSTLEPDQLDALLASLIDGARRAWPGVEIDARSFVAYIAERVPANAHLPIVLRAIHAADLYLAYACVLAHPRAIALFERHLLSNVPRFVSRVATSPALADEVQQRLREKFLLSHDASKLIAYTGRVALGGWLRVAALRTALNARRGEARALARTSKEVLPLARPADPELEFLKTRYAAEVQSAFETTLAGLPKVLRTVLQMHYLDDLTIDEIGAVLDVHRSTAARWIREARAALMKQTKRLLRSRLRSSPSEVESILRIVWSRIDLSFGRCFSTDHALSGKVAR